MDNRQFSQTLFPSFLGKKHYSPNPFDNSIFRPMITNELKNEYENISWIYKHIFSFDWDDKFIKENQKILEHLFSDSLWFLYSSIYFPKDIEKIYDINEKELIQILSSFKGENETINIKRNSLEKIKIELIEDLYQIVEKEKSENNNHLINTSSLDSNSVKLNEIESFVQKELMKISEINKNKIRNLHQKLNICYISNIEKENSFIDKTDFFSFLDSQKKNFNFYFNEYSLLKDTSLILSEPINKFCSYLLSHSLRNNLKKKSDKKIFDFVSELKRTKESEDWICNICNNGDLDDNQLIYECDECSVTVHQSCYGILTDSVENWICDSCKKFKNKNISYNLECILCPCKGGAMKQANLPNDCIFVKKLKDLRNGKEINKINSTCVIPSDSFDNIENVWVHLSCALWNPSIFFTDFDEKSGIRLIDTIKFEQFCELCNICNKRFYGPTIKCSSTKCNFRCHPECARINGYCLEIENEKKVLNYNFYCFEHPPLKLVKILKKIYKNKAVEIKQFSDFLSRIYKSYEREYGKNLIEIHPNNKLLKELNGEIKDLIQIEIKNQSNISTNNSESDRKNVPFIREVQLTPYDKKFIEEFQLLCLKISNSKKINLKIEKENNEIKYSILPEIDYITINYEDTLSEDFPWEKMNIDNNNKRDFYLSLVPNENKFKEIVLNNMVTVEILTDKNGEKVIKQYNEDNNIYCYCKRKCYGEFMICCQYEDECVGSYGGWFHPKCVPELKNMSENELIKINFTCKECLKAHSKGN